MSEYVYGTGTISLHGHEESYECGNRGDMHKLAYKLTQLHAQLDERDARIAELEAAQRWVSVDERLPDYGVDVMVYANTPLDRNTWDIARRDELYGWTFFTEWEFGAPTPTHWIPLPPPPVTDVTP